MARRPEAQVDSEKKRDIPGQNGTYEFPSVQGSFLVSLPDTDMPE